MFQAREPGKWNSDGASVGQIYGKGIVSNTNGLGVYLS